MLHLFACRLGNVKQHVCCSLTKIWVSNLCDSRLCETDSLESPRVRHLLTSCWPAWQLIPFEMRMLPSKGIVNAVNLVEGTTKFSDLKTKLILHRNDRKSGGGVLSSLFSTDYVSKVWDTWDTQYEIDNVIDHVVYMLRGVSWYSALIGWWTTRPHIVITSHVHMLHCLFREFCLSWLKVIQGHSTSADRFSIEHIDSPSFNRSQDVARPFSFFKFLEDMSSFCRATDLGFWWRLLWDSFIRFGTALFALDPKLCRVHLHVLIHVFALYLQTIRCIIVTWYDQNRSTSAETRDDDVRVGYWPGPHWRPPPLCKPNFFQFHFFYWKKFGYKEAFQ